MESLAVYATQIVVAFVFSWENVGLLAICGACHYFDIGGIKLTSPVITWLQSTVEDL